MHQKEEELLFKNQVLVEPREQKTFSLTVNVLGDWLGWRDDAERMCWQEVPFPSLFVSAGVVFLNFFFFES